MRRLLLISALFAFFPFFARAQEVPVWWQPVAEYNMLPIERMYDTVSAACEVIAEKSLKPVSAKDFAFTAVQSLSTIDRKITALMDGKRVLILLDDRILKSFPAPEENDCSNWTRLALAAAVEVRPYSRKAQKADAEEIFNIFINAALGTIDSYSHYTGADPAELAPLKRPAGLGISYRRIGRYLEITEIVPDGAASYSDLAVGDRISAINGKPVMNLSRIQILNLLRGEEGSDAFLTLRKDGKEQKRTLVRKRAAASPVTYSFDDENKLMTIKISAFSNTTVSALQTTLGIAFRKKASGLVIDLRGNTGGLLKEAVLAADLFLPEGYLIIKTEGRHEETKHQYVSTAKNYRPVYPIAILIDGKTASSAEFFAGVLQEYRHATVIGTPSYGKSLIQANETLPDGGELYLTWARYYLPSGYTPQGYGIYPNLCTSGKTASDFKDLDAPLSDLEPWRNGNEENRRKLLESCPRQSRKDETLEYMAAKYILLNQKRYERALSDFSLDSAQK